MIEIWGGELDLVQRYSDPVECTVQNHDVSIWTQTFGDDGDNGIVLISGAMAPAAFWSAEFRDRLADLGHFVIRFDSRDVGYSTHFAPARGDGEEPPYVLDDMVEDVHAICTNFHLDRPVIAGHSLGGTVAQLFAVKYPERIEQLFLLSSPIIATGDNAYTETDGKTLDAMWRVLMSNQMYPDYERGRDEFFRIWRYLNGDHELDLELAEEYTRRLYETEVIEPAYNHTKIQEGIADVWCDLRGLNVPIRFLYGDKDYLASNLQNIQILADSLPTAEVTVLEGAGHMYFSKDVWGQVLSVFAKALA